jgi:muramidase (phage lysozyme)
MPDTHAKVIKHATSGKPLVKLAQHKTTEKTNTAAKTVKVDKPAVRRAENEEYLKNTNVKAMLQMIAKSEGGDYHAKYGWTPGNTALVFSDESTHPGPGKDGHTTAAGLYQINKAGWTEHGVKAQGLSDFSPHTQDMIAVEAMRYRHALDAVLGGDLKTAVAKLKSYEWSSFQVHPYKTLEAWFTEAGGTVQ